MPRCSGCAAAVSEVCNCSLNPGTNITITGDGSEAVPYIISADQSGTSASALGRIKTYRNEYAPYDPLSLAPGAYAYVPMMLAQPAVGSSLMIDPDDPTTILTLEDAIYSVTVVCGIYVAAGNRGKFVAVAYLDSNGDGHTVEQNAQMLADSEQLILTASLTRWCPAGGNIRGLVTNNGNASQYVSVFNTYVQEIVRG